MTLWTRYGRWIDGNLHGSTGQIIWRPSEAVKLPSQADYEAAGAKAKEILDGYRIPSYEELEDLRAQ